MAFHFSDRRSIAPALEPRVSRRGRCAILERDYNGTRVRFVGVAHTPRTFREQKPLFESEVKSAEILVVEGDEAVVRTARRTWLGRKLPGTSFFASINQLAEAHGVETICFEQDGAQDMFATANPSITISVPSAVVRSSIYWAPMVVLSLFASGIGVYVANDPKPFRTLPTAALLSAVAFLRELFHQRVSLIADCRDVLLVTGIKRLIADKAPGSITIIYGRGHLAAFFAYLANPELLSRDAAAFGISVAPEP